MAPGVTETSLMPQAMAEADVEVVEVIVSPIDTPLSNPMNNPTPDFAHHAVQPPSTAMVCPVT